MTHHDIKNRPRAVKLEQPEFPLFIEDDSRKPSSFIVISYPDNTWFEDDPDRELFVIAGGTIDMRDREIRIELAHSFAKDEEGSTASVASFSLQNMVLEKSYGTNLTFSAFLMSAAFYPEGHDPENFPEGFNPFIGAEKENWEEDDYANYGYPYSPPQVRAEGLTFPMQVSVRLVYNISGSVPKRMKRMKQEFQDRRAERLRKAEQERVKREAERAERQKQREAYLQTEDGKVELAQDKARQRVRYIDTGSDFTEAQLHQLAADAREYARSLPEEDVRRLAPEGARGISWTRSGDTGRLAFLKALEQELTQLNEAFASA